MILIPARLTTAHHAGARLNSRPHYRRGVTNREAATKS